MSETLDGRRLTSSRLLARNVALNALGWLIPVGLALVAIPVLVRAIGAERFGVLSLVWTLVGYFSLFDLGLGRALTQLIAERVGRDEHEELPELVWTATWLLVPLGALGGAAVALLAPWLVERVLRVPPALQAESVAAFRWIGLAIPFTVSTAGFRGVLEAVQAFRAINALRVPLALITFVGPLLVLPFGTALPPMVAVLAIGRVGLWLAHVAAARRAFAPLRQPRAPERRLLRPLLAVGGWMTVSNVVSPLMYSLDRFAVAALLSVTAVSYYSTAYEAVTRLWVVTSILLPVLFPALGVALQRDRAQAALLLDRGARTTLGAVFPAALALSAFAPEWLTVWLGPEFGRNAAVLAQGLAAAVFVNVAGQLAYTVLQAGGRADVTGRLHLLELVPYLGALWLLLHGAGTTGVVIAWGLRVLVDTAALLWAASRLQPAAAAPLGRVAWRAAVGAPLVIAPAWMPGDGARAALAALVLAAYAVYVVTPLIAP
ncbi:flippase, partial [Roseisolibacter sp. H3M3-2]|uniref:flippase n=1 Tax=Roseisolibacter sp. H3M3-2 TaxID=3031323 RepID=UPI0023DCCCB2